MSLNQIEYMYLKINDFHQKNHPHKSDNSNYLNLQINSIKISK